MKDSPTPGDVHVDIHATELIIDDQLTLEAPSETGAVSTEVHRQTMHRLTCFVVATFAFTLAARAATDPDMGWHLRSGQWMVEHQTILRSEPFSWTSVGIHEPLEWISQISMFVGHETIGLTGLGIVVCALAALCAYLVYRACEGPPLLRGPLVAIASFAASQGWTVRPQMLTWVFSAITVLVVVAYRRAGPDADRLALRLWWLVPMFALWSNIHLCWFYGLAVLWMVVAGELMDRVRHRGTLSLRAVRSLAAVAAASSLAVMVNPVGPRIYGLIVSGRDVAERVGISEYLPTRFRGHHRLFFALLALTVLVLVWSWHRVSLADLGLVVGTGYFSWTTVRTVPLFCTVAPPVISHYVITARARRKAEHQALVLATEEDDHSEIEPHEPSANEEPPVPVGAPARVAGKTAKAVTVAMVVVTSALAVRYKLQPGGVAFETSARYPVDAVRWIKANDPAGPMFNPYGWGGYLIWNLPSYPVALDGRAEVHLDLIQAVEEGNGYEVFERRRVRLAVLERFSPIVRAMLNSNTGWSVVYYDGTAVVLTRT